MAAGIDPYLLPSAEAPDFYRTFSPTTVSPAHLLLYEPLRAWPYLRQRKLHFLMDWLLVGAVGFLILRLPRELLPNHLALFLLAVLLVADRALRLHFDRGQAYLLLLFLCALFTLSYIRSERDRSAGWVAVFVLAILILLRPTYLLALAGCAILGWVRFAARIAVFVLLLLTTCVLCTGARPWRSYIEMLRGAEEQHFRISVEQRVERTGAPSLIEGLDFRKHLSVNGYEHDRTFLGILGFRGLASWSVEHRRALLIANRLGLMIAAVAGMFLLWRLRLVNDTRIKVAALLLLPLNVETFGPQRYAYADVLLVLPLIMLIFVTSDQIGKRIRAGVDLYAILASVLVALTSQISFGSVGAISVVRYFVLLLSADIVLVWLSKDSYASARFGDQSTVSNSKTSSLTNDSPSGPIGRFTYVDLIH
jgi:hypothetical protein